MDAKHTVWGGHRTATASTSTSHPGLTKPTTCTRVRATRWGCAGVPKNSAYAREPFVIHVPTERGIANQKHLEFHHMAHREPETPQGLVQFLEDADRLPVGIPEGVDALGRSRGVDDGGGMATQQHQLAPTGHGDAHQKWQGSARRQLRISGLGSLPVVRRSERMALHVGKVRGHGHPPLSHMGCDGPRRRRAAAAGGGAAWVLGRTPDSPTRDTLRGGLCWAKKMRHPSGGRRGHGP